MEKFEKIHEKIETAIKSANDLSPSQLDLFKAYLQNEETEFRRVAEMTTTANIDRVVNVFIPSIKKLARDSIIDKIVGVQAIKSRVALVQYIDYVYSETAAGVNAGDSAIDKVTDTTYSNDPGEGQNIVRAIDVVFKEKEVKARQRKLSGRWTFEASDAAEYAVNLENEITKAIANKIVEEINFEVIGDLYAGASGATVPWEAPAPTDTPVVKERKEKELFYAILDVAAEIYNKTRRYPNFVIASPKISSILKRNGTYIATGNGGTGDIRRLFLSGVLEDEFTLFTVPSLQTNDVLVGYKGPSELDAGYIYAPYLPLIIMDSFFNVENWTWVKSVGSFYAKSDPLMDLYGTVHVTFP